MMQNRLRSIQISAINLALQHRRPFSANTSMPMHKPTETLSQQEHFHFTTNASSVKLCKNLVRCNDNPGRITRPLSTSSTRTKRVVPRKAPIKFTPRARKFFKSLLEQKTQKSENDRTVGIMLKYQQSQTGEPRMVYTFDFVNQNQISNRDEPVSLEVIESNRDSSGQEEEMPKSPEDSYDDGLPKLYIHQHAFLKVLGCTIDIDEVNFTPVLFDREGNLLDPNA